MVYLHNIEALFWFSQGKSGDLAEKGLRPLKLNVITIFIQESGEVGVDEDEDHGKTMTTRHWKEVTPTPDRSSWLPVVSYYEQKGIDEGRKTMLQCWEKIE